MPQVQVVLAGHTHEPPKHLKFVPFSLQLFEHEPQFVAVISKSTHTPLQFVCPTGQFIVVVEEAP